MKQKGVRPAQPKRDLNYGWGYFSLCARCGQKITYEMKKVDGNKYHPRCLPL